jgi:hypothetical protein
LASHLRPGAALTQDGIDRFQRSQKLFEVFFGQQRFEQALRDADDKARCMSFLLG